MQYLAILIKQFRNGNVWIEEQLYGKGHISPVFKWARSYCNFSMLCNNYSYVSCYSLLGHHWTGNSFSLHSFRWKSLKAIDGFLYPFIFQTFEQVIYVTRQCILRSLNFMYLFGQHKFVLQDNSSIKCETVINAES